MTSGDLHRLSVRELSWGLQRREFSASELLAHCRQRIERIDPVLGAFVHLDPGAAAAAAESDARLKAGEPLSPLDGTPVAVKDNLLVRGAPTGWGSPLFQDRVAEHDEAPVARLRKTGAVIIGKTSTPELSLRGVTESPVSPPTRNPWDPGLTPGGSSGGAAAAVAAGLVPLALATDGGGSIRRPAAHTGLVGLKTGLGRILRHSGLPELMNDFETVGPMARTVEGARMLFEALAAGASPGPWRRPWRVLAIERIGQAPLDPGIATRFWETVDRFADFGCEVECGAFPLDIEPAMAAWRRSMEVGLARLASLEPRFFELVAPDFAEQARAGQALTAADHAAQLSVVAKFRAEVAEVFEAVDVILTPTVAAQPWPIGQPYPPLIDGRDAGPRGHAVYTGWVNVCGHPAIALPTAPHDDGLPTGIQMVGRLGAEEMLFELAANYESASPWSDRWPALAG